MTESMSISVPERRRAPRVGLEAGSWLSVPATWPVQLVDLSLGGLAFSSPYRLEVGRTVSVRAPLGREALNTEARVCWSRPRVGTTMGRPHYDIGAAFLPLDEGSRRALEGFLKLNQNK